MIQGDVLVVAVGVRGHPHRHGLRGVPVPGRECQRILVADRHAVGVPRHGSGAAFDPDGHVGLRPTREPHRVGIGAALVDDQTGHRQHDPRRGIRHRPVRQVRRLGAGGVPDRVGRGRRIAHRSRLPGEDRRGQRQSHRAAGDRHGGDRHRAAHRHREGVRRRHRVPVQRHVVGQRQRPAGHHRRAQRRTGARHGVRHGLVGERRRGVAHRVPDRPRVHARRHRVVHRHRLPGRHRRGQRQRHRHAADGHGVACRQTDRAIVHLDPERRRRRHRAGVQRLVVGQRQRRHAHLRRAQRRPRGVRQIVRHRLVGERRHQVAVGVLYRVGRGHRVAHRHRLPAEDLRGQIQRHRTGGDGDRVAAGERSRGAVHLHLEGARRRRRARVQRPVVGQQHLRTVHHRRAQESLRGVIAHGLVAERRRVVARGILDRLRAHAGGHRVVQRHRLPAEHCRSQRQRHRRAADRDRGRVGEGTRRARHRHFESARRRHRVLVQGLVIGQNERGPDYRRRAQDRGSGVRHKAAADPDPQWTATTAPGTGARPVMPFIVQVPPADSAWILIRGVCEPHLKSTLRVPEHYVISGVGLEGRVGRRRPGLGPVGKGRWVGQRVQDRARKAAGIRVDTHRRPVARVSRKDVGNDLRERVASRVPACSESLRAAVVCSDHPTARRSLPQIADQGGFRARRRSGVRGVLDGIRAVAVEGRGHLARLLGAGEHPHLLAHVRGQARNGERRGGRAGIGPPGPAVRVGVGNAVVVNHVDDPARVRRVAGAGVDAEAGDRPRRRLRRFRPPHPDAVPRHLVHHHPGHLPGRE